MGLRGGGGIGVDWGVMVYVRMLWMMIDGWGLDGYWQVVLLNGRMSVHIHL